MVGDRVTARSVGMSKVMVRKSPADLVRVRARVRVRVGLGLGFS